MGDRMMLIFNSGKCGDNLTWTYDENQKLLDIDGSGPMLFDSIPWEEWKDEVYPGDSRNIRVEGIGRRGSLTMEHPCRKVRVISDVGAEDHCENRDAAQDVDGYDSFIHLLIFRLSLNILFRICR